MYHDEGRNLTYPQGFVMWEEHVLISQTSSNIVPTGTPTPTPTGNAQCDSRFCLGFPLDGERFFFSLFFIFPFASLSGVNRKVTYSLSDSADGFFSVDRSSGIIILEHPLDRELQSSYNITVKASDQSIVLTLSSFATVTITVLDINDNPPVFERRDYLVTVPEDTSPGTEVLSVFATSQDIGTNAEIAYLIRSGNEKGKFRINSKTGL